MRTCCNISQPRFASIQSVSKGQVKVPRTVDNSNKRMDSQTVAPSLYSHPAGHQYSLSNERTECKSKDVAGTWCQTRSEHSGPRQGEFSHIMIQHWPSLKLCAQFTLPLHGRQQFNQCICCLSCHSSPYPHRHYPWLLETNEKIKVAAATAPWQY